MPIAAKPYIVRTSRGAVVFRPHRATRNPGSGGRPDVRHQGERRTCLEQKAHPTVDSVARTTA